jgi:putative PIN family toxin of toxin-antitoxin system
MYGMKVVVDTSVWIAALISQDGANRTLIRMALQGEIEPQISTALFLEYESVMQRDKIRQQCPLSIAEQNELFEAYLSTCRWNEIFYLWRPNLKDKDDDFLIELAVASNSSVIITDNIKDVKHGELQFDFEVITPKLFIQRNKQ